MNKDYTNETAFLYHGSESVIEHPIFGYGNPHNDYGLGFYCTEDRNMAMEWAVSEEDDGFTNKYSLNFNELTVLDLCSSEFNVLNWLAVLLENRTFDITTPLAREGRNYLLKEFMIPYKEYDIVRGYRADDSYFSFASDFIDGRISVRQLSEAMRLGSLGEQVVLKSKKAFENITFSSYDYALRRNWLSQKKLRDTFARKRYFNMDRDSFVKGDIYIYKILDEEIKADDPRIR